MAVSAQDRLDAISMLKQMIVADGQDPDEAEKAATKIIDWKLGGGTPDDLPGEMPE